MGTGVATLVPPVTTSRRSRCVVCSKPCFNDHVFKQGYAHATCIPVDERPVAPKLKRRKLKKLQGEDYLL